MSEIVRARVAERLGRLRLNHVADRLDAILSDAEWDDIHKHAQRHKPPLPIFVLLGLMIDSIPEPERDAWFQKELPAPIRVAYRLAGRRRYERALRRLRPDRSRAAAPAMA